MAGGRGLKDAKNFKLLEELADLLGGRWAPPGARWMPAGFPTPTRSARPARPSPPSFTLPYGFSGASQHVVGMQSADVIVAINKDPQAPIFQVADVGLVGDLFEIVPALIQEIKKDRG